MSWKTPDCIGLVGCMDEANLLPGEKGDSAELAEKQIYFGLAGTGVARLDNSNQDKLPNSIRKLFLDNQRNILQGFNAVMNLIGGVLYSSSHAGCVWAGLQNIVNVVDTTSRMSNSAGVEYAGHINYGTKPVRLGSSPAFASIERDSSQHSHVATSIVCPVGGGITGAELYQLGGDPFIIDVDFAAAAVDRGMSVQAAVGIVAAQLDLADGIMNRNIGVSRMRTFNAGRLPTKHVYFHQKIFDLAVETLI